MGLVDRGRRGEEKREGGRRKSGMILPALMFRGNIVHSTKLSRMWVIEKEGGSNSDNQG
jgi:hypothetical protein